eukprot:4464799-Pyramimonas_sp.AAC.1
MSRRAGKPLARVCARKAAVQAAFSPGSRRRAVVRQNLNAYGSSAKATSWNPQFTMGAQAS